MDSEPSFSSSTLTISMKMRIRAFTKFGRTVGDFAERGCWIDAVTRLSTGCSLSQHKRTGRMTSPSFINARESTASCSMLPMAVSSEPRLGEKNCLLD
jgi:hypothetical protein